MNVNKISFKSLKRHGRTPSFRTTIIATTVLMALGSIQTVVAKDINASITQAVDGNGGELNVPTGQAIVSGSVTNFSKFNVNQNLIVVAGGGISSANGDLVAVKGIDIRAGDGSKPAASVEVKNLEVADHRVSNSGTLVVHGNITSKINQNQASGEVQNTAGASMTVTGNITADKQLYNAGDLNLNGTQQTLSGAKLHNVGTINVSGVVDAQSMAVTNSGGSITSEEQGKLTVKSLVNQQRTVNSTTTNSTIKLQSLEVLGSIRNSVFSEIDAGSLTVGGLFENEGITTVNTLTATAGNIIRNNGQLTVKGAIQGEDATLEVKKGEVVASSLSLKKVDIQKDGTLSMTGEGTINVQEKLQNLGTLKVGSTLIAKNATLSNQGVLVRTDGGVIDLIDIDRFINAGTQAVEVKYLQVNSGVDNSGILKVHGDIVGGVTGSFTNQQAGTVELDGNLTIGTGIEANKGNGIVILGTLKLTGTDQVLTSNVLYNKGSIFAQNGSLTVNASIQNHGLISKSETESLEKLNAQGIINNGSLNVNELLSTGALINLGTVEADSITSTSLENRANHLTAQSIQTTTGSVSNSGTMHVTGDIVSATGVNNSASMTVEGSIRAVGQISVQGQEALLTMTASDAQMTAASVYNTGKIYGTKVLTANAGTFTNVGTVAGGENSALQAFNVQTFVNDGVARVVNMTSEGDVTNNGKIESTGVVKAQSLLNAKKASITAESLSTAKANHTGHMSNLGVMTVTGEVNVQGHFGNLESGEFKAGTLTTSNATDNGKSFEVTNLNLEVSPETSKGLGFVDFMSETSVAKVGTLTTSNGQLKVFGAGVEIGTVADASNVIVQVDDFTPGKAKIGTNNGSMTVEISSEMAEQLDPNNLTSGMQKAADTVSIDQGNKDKSVFAPSSTILGELEAYTDANGKIVAVKEEANVFNVGVSEMASTSMLAWRAENNDMFKRLGDVRRGDEKNGVWARVMAGESEYGTQNLENDFTTLQFGYDHRVGIANEWILGGAFTYTKGDSTFDCGTGDNYQFGLALYGSYLGSNGGYVDVIGKYSRLKNEFDAFGGVGKGEYYGNGVSMSVEAGHRFDTAYGLYVEPQVEFTYGYLTDVNYSTSAGAAVAQDSMKSAVGRVGFNVGKSFERGNIHAGVSWLKDWEGETSVKMSYGGHTRNFTQDLGDDWVEFEVGGAYDLRDNLKLYGSFETTTGGDVKMPWLANVGVRLVW